MLPQFKMQLPFLIQFCPQVGIEEIYSTQPGVSTRHRIVRWSGNKSSRALPVIQA